MTYSDVSLMIDGAWTKGANGRTIPVINPATEEVIGQVAHAEKSDLDFVVEFLPDTPAGGLHGPYFSLLCELQELFGRNVDLVDRNHIENPYFVEVLKLTQRPVYESPAAA